MLGWAALGSAFYENPPLKAAEQNANPPRKLQVQSKSKEVPLTTIAFSEHRRDIRSIEATNLFAERAHRIDMKLRDVPVH
jgi:hypothetical protein